MKTTDKDFLLVRTIPFWINLIEYGLIGMLGVPLFKELETSPVNILRLTLIIIAAAVLIAIMFWVNKRYVKSKSGLGLFLKDDHFIYSPNDSLTLEVDWKNIEKIIKKETGISNYIIPVLKNSKEIRIVKAGWPGKGIIKRNTQLFGMPVVINPYSFNTSVYDLYEEFNKRLSG